MLWADVASWQNVLEHLSAMPVAGPGSVDSRACLELQSSQIGALYTRQICGGRRDRR